MAPSFCRLPLPWLAQLVTAVTDPKSRYSIFCTCKLLRDLTLEQAATVQCSFKQVVAAHVVESLQLVARCRKGREVKLKLLGWDGDIDDVSLVLCTSTINELCSHASRAPSQPMHCVTDLEIQGQFLGNLVPLELVSTFPNMQQFTKFGRLANFIGKWYAQCPCPQVKRLVFCHLQKQFDYDSEDQISTMQAQLRCLCNLQEVACLGSKLSPSAVWYFVNSIQVLNQQLTSLQLETGTQSLKSLLKGNGPYCVSYCYQTKRCGVKALRCCCSRLHNLLCCKWAICAYGLIKHSTQAR